MKPHFLSDRHIGLTTQDQAAMLKAIGVSSLDTLIDETIPADIRLQEPLDLQRPLSEHRYTAFMA